MLQWGHSQTAVETCHKRFKPSKFLRFNGATAKQLWKPISSNTTRPPERRLQWGHSQTAVETEPNDAANRVASPRSFNGATAKQLWKQHASDVRKRLSLASMGPQPNSCGNQAAALDVLRSLIASMGPQPNSCGNKPSGLRVLARIVGFNGATAKQLWKHIRHIRGRLGWNGFNGATAKQLWKRGCPLREATGGGRLQWGHSQTAVETPRPVLPLPPQTSRFNGATAKQLWKLILAVPILRARPASMGPQPNSCGNINGHEKIARARKASMGPQPNSCGNREQRNLSRAD